MSDQQEAEITKIIADIVELDPASLSPDGELGQMYELDSVAMLEILVTLERRYNVRIQENDIQGLTTIRQGVELIRIKLGQG